MFSTVGLYPASLLLSPSPSPSHQKINISAVPRSRSNHATTSTACPFEFNLLQPLLSALQTSTVVAISVLASLAFTTVIWLLSVRIGEPFGVWIMQHCIQPLEKPVTNPTPRYLQMTRNVEKIISGLVGMVMMIICMFYEHAAAEMGEGFIESCRLVMKGCIEGLIVLGMLRSVVTVYTKMIST